MVFLNEYMPGAFLNDLQLFDPAKVAWTDITSNAKGDPPSPRRSMGFAADGEGMLYVFGGTDDSGKYNSSIAFVRYIQCTQFTIKLVSRFQTLNAKLS